MLKEYDQHSEFDPPEQSRAEIDEMWKLSQRILANFPQQITNVRRNWFFRWFSQEPKRRFDSRNDNKMALLTRAASKSQIAPVLEIDEWESLIEIALLGKNPTTGEEVRVMEIDIPNNPYNPFATSVIMCQDIYVNSISYSIFSKSTWASLVSDVVIPSLRTIDNYLERKASW